MGSLGWRRINPFEDPQSDSGASAVGPTKSSSSFNAGIAASAHSFVELMVSYLLGQEKTVASLAATLERGRISGMDNDL